MLGNKGTGREYRDGGCRGGQDQFKWEDVKADAYRESYLGHSLHAPVGRWQKGKDLLWYTKKDAGADGVNHAARLRAQAADERRAEIAAVKQMEEDMMNQQLGLATKKRRVDGPGLEKSEVEALLARGTTSRAHDDIERVSGLGAAASRRLDNGGRELSLAEKEMARRRREEVESRLIANGHGDSNGMQNGDDGRAQVETGYDSKREKKKMKKEKKRLKKERKREKKERKRQRKRSRSSSGSSDSSS